ncbi:DUF4214 domain-containing protein, partial [Methylobacterium nigriterrae]|uniref:DUF4214 domain-containing protein n=1 Tax=Methylobacterium nigriterrae TaxID=3127512 RepID=UPI003013DD07
QNYWESDYANYDGAFRDGSKPQSAQAFKQAFASGTAAAGFSANGPVGVMVATEDAANVARLYHAVLDRAPDPAGEATFVAALQHGATLSQVAGAMLGSAEYGTAHPNPSAAAFLDGLYLGALGRHPDQVGLQAWQAALSAGSTRADVASAIAQSREAQTHLFAQVEAGDAAGVARLYQAVLDRSPDAAGEIYFTRAVQNGAGLNQVAAALLGSGEFAATRGAPNDAAYLDGLYRSALGRHAEAAGLQGWQDALSHGATRADVAVAIAQSAEAQAHLAAQVQAAWSLF